MSTRNRTRRRAKGTALLELVMIIPVIGLVIASIFFFGKYMHHQQHLTAAGRYHVWRSFHGWIDMADEQGNILTPTEQVDWLFLYNQSEDLNLEGVHGMGTETIDILIDVADSYSSDAGELAEASIGDRFDHGRWGRVSARFPNDQPIWDAMSGRIRARHMRPGRVWRRGQVSYLQPLRDQFLERLDNAVQGFASDPLRENLEALYLRRW